MRRQEKMEVNLLVDLFSIKTPMKTAEKLGKEWDKQWDTKITGDGGAVCDFYCFEFFYYHIKWPCKQSELSSMLILVSVTGHLKLSKE